MTRHLNFRPTTLATGATAIALLLGAGAPALANTGSATTHRTTVISHHAKKAKVKKAKAKAKVKVGPVVLTPFEQTIADDINGARHDAGLAPLTVVAGATDVARRYSVQLAALGTLVHNPALLSQLQGAGSSQWTAIEENIGTGPADDPADLFAAYMASPHHRDNILDPSAKYLGVGTVQVVGPLGPQAWNVCDFVNAYDPHYGKAKTTASAATTDTVGQMSAAISGH